MCEICKVNKIVNSHFHSLVFFFFLLLVFPFVVFLPLSVFFLSFLPPLVFLPGLLVSISCISMALGLGRPPFFLNSSKA